MVSFRQWGDRHAWLVVRPSGWFLMARVWVTFGHRALGRRPTTIIFRLPKSPVRGRSGTAAAHQPKGGRGYCCLRGQLVVHGQLGRPWPASRRAIRRSRVSESQGPPQVRCQRVHRGRLPHGGGKRADRLRTVVTSGRERNPATLGSAHPPGSAPGGKRRWPGRGRRAVKPSARRQRSARRPRPSDQASRSELC